MLDRFDLLNDIILKISTCEDMQRIYLRKGFIASSETQQSFTVIDKSITYKATIYDCGPISFMLII